MSLHGSFLSDEQFLCSICLDVFNNPSSTPCGHSYCMACISKYWDGSKVCQCPLCKKTFQKRPDLQINRSLREITEHFREMQSSSGAVLKEKRMGRGGDGGIPDDLFVELKKKLPRSHRVPSTHGVANGVAIPASLTVPPTSLTSSVPNSPNTGSTINTAEPPAPAPPFPRSYSRRRFTIGAGACMQNLPLCEIHHRGLMIYCRTDRECICPVCQVESHQDHETVTVENEWTDNLAQLNASKQEIQEMIRQRMRKIEEIKLSVTELQGCMERETAGSVSLLSALVSALERSQAELMEVMEMSRRAAVHQADATVRLLQLEVDELRRRDTALNELSQSEDHLYCVKTFPLLSTPPPTKDWSGVSVNGDLGTGTIYRSLAAQVEKFQEELRNAAERGFPPAPVPEPSPVRTLPRIKRVQEYAVDVTMDCNTAHPRLVISEDMKSVRCGDRHQLLPENPERFDRVVCVLGREAISSGRHYWEVEVGGKTDWDLGVARQTINRKGKIEVTPSNGYWFLSLRDRHKYAFRTEPSTDVHLNLRPQKMGIFVDFEKGQVSFYNVDAKIHIYTFNDTFSECIFPFFSPCTNKSGKNDGPLIITPVTLKE